MAGQLFLQAGDIILGSNPQKLANGVHIASSQIELACVGKFNQCIQNLRWSFKSLRFFHCRKEGNFEFDEKIRRKNSLKKFVK